MKGEKVYHIYDELVDCEIYIECLSDIIKAANINMSAFCLTNAKYGLDFGVELIKRNHKNKEEGKAIKEKEVYYISGSNELANRDAYIKYFSSILIRLKENIEAGRLEDAKRLLEIGVKNIDTNKKLGNIVS
ncbi:MAG: hypothetical protein HYW34_02205 [Candidatus Brennerbacteria bacterium]|nr:hypothetical protein [Candidatus Brennerbacteria bacterium]